MSDFWIIVLVAVVVFLPALVGYMVGVQIGKQKRNEEILKERGLWKYGRGNR